MQIKIRLIGAFRVDRFEEEVFNYPAETRANEIVDKLQIPYRVLGCVLINGHHSRIYDSLNDGDTLSIMPILGGG